MRRTVRKKNENRSRVSEENRNKTRRKRKESERKRNGSFRKNRTGEEKRGAATLGDGLRAAAAKGGGGYRAAAAGEGRGVGHGLGRRGVVWGLGFDLMFWRGVWGYLYR